MKWTTAAAAAVGIGLGTALATSAGPAGFVVGAGVAVVLWLGGRRRHRNTSSNQSTERTTP